MRTSLNRRRGPRQVGATSDDDESEVSGNEPNSSQGEINPTRIEATSLSSDIRMRSTRSSLTAREADSTVKRTKTKARKPSSLRTSLALGDEDQDDNTGVSGVVTPKRSSLSRVAIQRNASQRTSRLAVNLPQRQTDDEDEADNHASRPRYSADELRELRNSTPSTPRDFDASNALEQLPSDVKSLDLASKLARGLDPYDQSSAIPSAAEIAEKKARRARMAKEMQAEEYISLDPDDEDLDNDYDHDNAVMDDRGRLVLKAKDKYGQSESRLVRDDEDVMENFDEFTEDGGIAIGRRAEIEAAKRRRQEMATQIAEAEGTGSDSDDSAASERARNDAFAAAQTRHGTYATNVTSEETHSEQRPRTPPIISPLPTLDSAIEGLRARMAELQTFRSQKLQEMDMLQKEKIRLGEEEVRIQRALKETAARFRDIRVEKGILPADTENQSSSSAVAAAALIHSPAEMPTTPANGEVEDVTPSQQMSETMSFPGFGTAGHGRGGLGMSRVRDEEEDW